MDDIPIEEIKEFEAALQEHFHKACAAELKEIKSTGQLTEEVENKIRAAVGDFKEVVWAKRGEQSEGE